MFARLASFAGPLSSLKKQGAPAFVPSSLPGLIAWFDASTITGVSNGGTVTKWYDVAPGTPRTLPVKYSYQGNPTYNSSDALLNGKPSVTYNGTSSNDVSYNDVGVNMPYGSQASTTYVVGYWNGSGSGQEMFGWGNNNTGGRMAAYKAPEGMIFESSNMGSKARTVSANSPFIFSFAYVAGSNYTAATTHFNGVADTGEYPGFPGVPNIVYAGPPTYNQADISIGRYPTVNFGTPWWGGAVAEAIVYNVTHTNTERAQVTSYLSSKYGISI